MAARVMEESGAARVGIYLVDKATGRLTLRGCAAGETTERHSDRGIESKDLSTATLRDFIHAAPKDERTAVPLHEGKTWIGVVAGVAHPKRPFDTDSLKLFNKAAKEIVRSLRPVIQTLGGSRVDEDERAIDLPSEAIYGSGAGDGATVGLAQIYWSREEERPGPATADESPEAALERLEHAIDAAARDLQAILEDEANELFDVVTLLFSTHLLMLTDEAFAGAIRDLVRSGQTPEHAVETTVESFVHTFSGLREPRLAEKAHDVRDVGQRLLAKLAGMSSTDRDMSGHVVIADEVLPSDLIRVVMAGAAGLVIAGATITAHISILARSLSLPILLTDDRRVLDIAPRTPVLLDAVEGTLYISPTPQTIHQHVTPTEHESLTVLPASPTGGARTPSDETGPTVLATVNLLNDARRAATVEADGIGLYRSEFPFIIRNDYVDEAEQTMIYRSIIGTMPGKPVILRTVDIGGDKILAGRQEERNPFLGVRGIRFSLSDRPMFRRQLRAMLQAGTGSDLHILFPMVSGVEEIEEARAEIAVCSEELKAQGKPHHEGPKIGAMVELPAAVIDVEDLAAATDFLSIGTNDLTMYLLAVDRTNERLGELYRSHHPVVLKTIADIARRVRGERKPLYVCGEAAADPLMIPFFLGIGITRISVAPRLVGRVRSIAGRFDAATTRDLTERLLSIRTLREMDSYLSSGVVKELASQ
jgi:phosphotransferase system enzyme I (PtsP)